MGQVMPIYRLFVAGRMQGPGMFDGSAWLGRGRGGRSPESRSRALRVMGVIEVNGIRLRLSRLPPGRRPIGGTTAWM